jgi:Lrp/AsnC family leucine-responsive transcriptional regulator
LRQSRNCALYTQVQLKQHSKEKLNAYKTEVVKVPKIMECYHLTGSFDLLLRIACKDTDEYNLILNENLSVTVYSYKQAKWVQ